MKIEDLECLCEAIKYKSISVAAEKNYTSQSSYSTGINRLEKEVNTELLIRSSKGVVPTQLGEEFAKKAEIVLSIIKEMKEMADLYNFSDNLNLATSFAISEGLIPFCVNKIKEEDKEINISVSVMEDYNIYNNVSAGKNRLGLGLYNSKLLRGDLKFTPLFKNEYLVHVGPKSSLFDCDEIFMEDLFKEPYIVFGDEFLKEDADYWPRNNFSKETVFDYRCNNTGAIKRMIYESNYFCILPAFNSKFDPYVTKGLIRTKRIKDKNLEITYGYIENSRYKLGNVEKYFIEILNQVIEEQNLDINI